MAPDDAGDPVRTGHDVTRLLEQGGAALVAPYTGGESLRNPFNPWIFHVRAGYADETELMVQQLTTLGMNRVAVMYQDDGFGKAGLAGVEAALAKRGLGYEDLKAINPKIVFCNISGYGMTGPYKDMPSHGVAYDTWGGLVKAETDDEGFCFIPEHPSTGIHAGPLFGAFGVVSAILGARATGEGSALEIAQSDASAAMDWLRSETWKAYERPEDEVTGNPSDNYERRAPGTAGMRDGVRYQFYVTKDDRHVLFMASEQEFWKNFCDGVERPDLFETWPGSQYGDHAKGNRELQAILRDIFLTKTAAEWIVFGDEKNTPIAPVNTPQTIAEDPQFQDRFHWMPADEVGADMLGTPLKFMDVDMPKMTKAPTVGQHTVDVLESVLGYDEAKIAALRETGAIG